MTASSSAGLTCLSAELRFWLSITRRLPRVRGAGIVGNLVARFYNRIPRSPVIADIGGLIAELDPRECVEGGLLFYPQLYDFKEIAFLRDTLCEGGVFVDVGAHVGFYSLTAATVVKETGRVLSIEADPFIHDRLRKNIDLNHFVNIESMNVGASDRAERLSLGVNTTGNRAGSSFLTERPQSLSVSCLPLREILDRAGISKVDGMKLDIEGFEYRVVRKYFCDTAPDLRPGFLIVEHIWRDSAGTGGDVVAFLRDSGYRQCGSTAYNTWLVSP